MARPVEGAEQGAGSLATLIQSHCPVSIVRPISISEEYITDHIKKEAIYRCGCRVNHFFPKIKEIIDSGILILHHETSAKK